MWYAVIDERTGALRSVGTVLADPLPDGLIGVPLSAERPDLSVVEWDAAQRTMKTRAASPPRRRQVDAFLDEMKLRVPVAAALEAHIRAAWDATNSRGLP